MEFNTFVTPNPVLAAMKRSREENDANFIQHQKAHYYIKKFYNGDISREECIQFLMDVCHHGRQAAEINIDMAPTQRSFNNELDG